MTAADPPPGTVVGGPASGPAGDSVGGTAAGPDALAAGVAPFGLREVLDRPRILRLAIRSESVPAGAPPVAHGVVARIEGGFFVAGPPPTPFHTVALWAGVPPGVVSVGCVPTSADAAVEVWGVHETEAAEPAPGHRGRLLVERYGATVTLTCADPGHPDTGLVVDLLWEDG